ncbi:MAG: DUF2336 domain-containing protein [Alphaproteobacteria bacterium]
MMKRLLSRALAPSALPMLSYDEQKQLVQSADPAMRRALAERTDVRPEILYYMTDDAAPEVRRALAGNAATPVQADLVLAKDVDEEVRCDLALKIARLVPDMAAEEQDRVRELTVETLEMLAHDQLPRVRAILSEELKQRREVPLKVVRELAHDIEAIVSAPILEYSPLLSDADLIEVIAAGTAREALAAIARREEVSSDVAEAVVATYDVAAVADLLANKSAQIREDTLDQIIDNAQEVENWHEPLVLRPELSVRAVRRIATFVAVSLVGILAERNDLDEDTADMLAQAVRERIKSEEPGEGEELLRAQRMFEAGNLDDEALCEAIEAGNRAFVVAALTLATALTGAAVRKALASGSGQVVTALVWQAGYAMRTALRVQSKIARLSPGRMLNARDGVDYPLSEDEMRAEVEKLKLAA